MRASAARSTPRRPLKCSARARGAFRGDEARRTPLQIRHDAALALVVKGELDPVLALSLVVWPRKGSRLEDVPLERQYYAEEVREEIRARHAAGETIPELARKTGIPLGQVKSVCSAAGGAKRAPAELTLF
jgi:hypothetical protein